MRRIVIIILIVAMLIPTCSIAASYTPLIGDVNGDNKINGIDVTYILKSCVELIKLDFIEMIRADVTIDREIDTVDATILLRYIAFGNINLGHYEDCSCDTIPYDKCKIKGNITNTEAAVWLSEFTSDYIVTPNGGVAYGEVYAVNSTRESVFTIKASDCINKVEMWLTDENWDILTYATNDTNTLLEHTISGNECSYVIIASTERIAIKLIAERVTNSPIPIITEEI